MSGFAHQFVPQVATALTNGRYRRAVAPSPKLPSTILSTIFGCYFHLTDSTNHPCAPSSRSWTLLSHTWVPPSTDSSSALRAHASHRTTNMAPLEPASQQPSTLEPITLQLYRPNFNRNESLPKIKQQIGRSLADNHISLTPL